MEEVKLDAVTLAHMALDAAGKAGATQAEAFAVRSVTKSVYVDDTRIKICEEKEDQGIAMRAMKGKRLAQVSSTAVFENDAVACAKVATLLADRSPSSRTYDRFPLPSQATLSPGPWDDRIESAEAANLIELVKATIGTVAERGVKVPRGVLRVATIESTILNTNGVDVSHRSTLMYANYDSMAEGTSPGEGVVSFNSPWLEDYAPESLGERLAQQALSARDAKALDGPVKGTVMIAPWELGQMLATSIMPAVSAESVYKKRSPWAGMEGKQVASEKLTIVDDPSDRRGLLSAAYDDEGVPTSVKRVVEKGVLKTYLYDSYNSSIDRKVPSGNGMRRRPQDAQYLFRSSLACAPVNMVVSPGRRPPEEIISSMDEGVVVDRFAFPTVSPYTGAFSLEVRSAHIVRNGSTAGHIKHALVTGNMFDGLKNIVEVGNDATIAGDTILPSIAFDGFEVVGSR
ncbi:MAG: protease TldD [Methanomassiliicoccales archaeon PtaU1.Bin030]|nr:MAG: protease TldD [Methanomassiliicoccales archaeon PtaU1.Bin030]